MKTAFTRRSSAASAARVGASVKAARRPPKAANDSCLRRLVEALESKRLAARALYDEADRLEAELIETLGVGGSILLTDGRTAKVNDNFVDKNGQPRNVAYKPCGVRRFEVAIK